jgi:hypothetical protein
LSTVGNGGGNSITTAGRFGCEKMESRANANVRQTNLSGWRLKNGTGLGLNKLIQPPRKISPATICKTGAIAIYTSGRLAKLGASEAMKPETNETKQNEHD